MERPLVTYKGRRGYWLSTVELAEILGLRPKSLAQTRFLDRAAGRKPSIPYEKFGRAVRYFYAVDGFGSGPEEVTADEK
jgi:hypothetical protein